SGLLDRGAARLVCHRRSYLGGAPVPVSGRHEVLEPGPTGRGERSGARPQPRRISVPVLVPRAGPARAPHGHASGPAGHHLFLTETQKYTISEIVDRALRNKVIVNTFDSKGLFAPIPLGDASKRVLVVPQRPDLMGHKEQDQLTSYQRDVEVLGQLAYDTGGV